MNISEMKKLYVHWDLVRFMTEDKLDNDCMTLAYYGKNNEIYDLMVYLFKENDKWFVLVYESEESNNYDTYDFDNFEDARDFVDYLPYNHPEYKERPFKKV